MNSLILWSELFAALLILSTDGQDTSTFICHNANECAYETMICDPRTDCHLICTLQNSCVHSEFNSTFAHSSNILAFGKKALSNSTIHSPNNYINNLKGSNTSRFDFGCYSNDKVCADTTLHINDTNNVTITINGTYNQKIFENGKIYASHIDEMHVHCASNNCENVDFAFDNVCSLEIFHSNYSTSISDNNSNNDNNGNHSTPHPTGSPSNRPTSHPTPQPTGHPTRGPTARPTTRPTPPPTDRPTCNDDDCGGDDDRRRRRRRRRAIETGKEENMNSKDLLTSTTNTIKNHRHVCINNSYVFINITLIYINYEMWHCICESELNNSIKIDSSLLILMHNHHNDDLYEIVSQNMIINRCDNYNQGNVELINYNPNEITINNTINLNNSWSNKAKIETNLRDTHCAITNYWDDVDDIKKNKRESFFYTPLGIIILVCSLLSLFMFIFAILHCVLSTRKTFNHLHGAKLTIIQTFKSLSTIDKISVVAEFFDIFTDFLFSMDLLIATDSDTIYTLGWIAFGFGCVGVVLYIFKALLLELC